MEEVNMKKGDFVIKEGGSGDLLYIVSEGDFDCTKVINGEDKYLKTYSYGDAFGELALLYNAPRAATIKAKTDGVLFALDRQTFSYIMKNSANKKR